MEAKIKMVNHDFRYLNEPNCVKLGNKVIYSGKDAAKWLKNHKDRNIKSCAKLRYA